MTISSTTTKNQYTANGVNVAFTYAFKIFDEDDILVILTDLNGVDATQVITTDYTVSGVGADGGGTITFTTAPTLSYRVTLKRDEPLLQNIDYVENDDFPAAAHEEGLDRSAIRDQFLSEQVDRSITFSEGSATTGVNIPEPQADYFLGWNAAATNLENKLVAAGTVVSSYEQDRFNGTGAQTDFTLTFTPPAQNALLAWVDDVRQVSGVDYTVSGTTISFAVAPGSGTNNVVILNIANGATGNVPTDASVTFTKLNSDLVLDEDDMVSNSDTAISTQQSIKAYVDSHSYLTNVAYITSTGTWPVPTGVTAARFVLSGGSGGGGAGVDHTVQVSTAGGQSKVAISAVNKAVANGGSPGNSGNANAVAPAHGTATTGDFNRTGEGVVGGLPGVNSTNSRTGLQGGNGGLSVVDLTVVDTETYDITIGAAGADGQGTGSTTDGRAGQAGYCIIYY